VLISPKERINYENLFFGVGFDSGHSDFKIRWKDFFEKFTQGMKPVLWLHLLEFCCCDFGCYNWNSVSRPQFHYPRLMF